MRSTDYIENVIRSESIAHGALSPRQMRLLHAAMGMQTESAELTDMLKRNFFYGYNIDRVNALEELGDMLWYVAIAIHELQSSFEEVQEANIAKLQFRYPDQFDQHLAIARNSDNERRILETIFQQGSGI